jgi:general secretion pathway protein G
MKRFAKRRRSGFTLLELMLVMAILVIMAGMVGFAVLNMQQNANRDLALTQINTLRQACTQFRLNNGRFPATLDDLVILPAGKSQNQWRGPYLEAKGSGQPQVPVDPWGNPYTYQPDDANQRVVIGSAGADGQQGTADDIPDAMGK